MRRSIAPVVFLTWTCLWTLTQTVQSLGLSHINSKHWKHKAHPRERGLPTYPALAGRMSQQRFELKWGNEKEEETTSYRSIGEVVGGLHGGKYQFTSGGTYGDSGFVGRSRVNRIQEEEELEEEKLPKWAKNMHLPEGSDCRTVEIEVPSNSNRMDGMLRSATVTIQNDERTWEKFYAKIVPRCAMNSLPPNGPTPQTPFRVRPQSGHLAPRGGASNACNSNQPYSDSATIIVIHDENVLDCPPDGSVEWWLLAGTEEEKWYFKLKYVV